jgi:hypothetical protein
MNKPPILSDKEILEAFDGDFGEVYFDHKPTPYEILLIKLRLVSRATLEWVIKWGKEECTENHYKLGVNWYTRSECKMTPIKRRECPQCWADLSKEVEG